MYPQIKVKNSAGRSDFSEKVLVASKQYTPAHKSGSAQLLILVTRDSVFNQA